MSHCNFYLLVLQMWCRVRISNPGDAGSICSIHNRNYTVEVSHPLRFVRVLSTAQPELLTVLSLPFTGLSFE